LVEVLIIAFQKNSLMQVSTIATSSWNEPIAITTKKLELIQGGAKLAIVFCTLSSPIKLVEVHVVVVNIQV
jgi:hypothetical protein